MNKITAEELQKVKEKREQVIIVTERLSELLLQKIILDDIVEKTQQDFLDVIGQEEKYFSELNKKYGSGVLSMETGELELIKGE